MLKWIKISGIIFIMCMAGCTEDNVLIPRKSENTQPVKIKLVIRFIPMGPYTTDEGIYFDFTGGSIGIQKVEFEGLREAGEDVFFESDPEIDLPIIEFMEDEAVVCDVDLPQGIYTHIRLDLYLKTIGDTVFSNNYETSTSSTGFTIEGLYEHIYWNMEYYGAYDSLISFPFVFIIDKTEKFFFRSMHDEIINKPDRELLLVFNLANAFNSIDFKSFEEAEISGTDENQRIVISSNQNRDLYEILLYRLGLSTGMVLN